MERTPPPVFETPQIPTNLDQSDNAPKCQWLEVLGWQPSEADWEQGACCSPPILPSGSSVLSVSHWLYSSDPPPRPQAILDSGLGQKMAQKLAIFGIGHFGFLDSKFWPKSSTHLDLGFSGLFFFRWQPDPAWQPIAPPPPNVPPPRGYSQHLFPGGQLDPG